MTRGARIFDLVNVPLERGTTLIEASAGTGKTYSLAGLVLRLLLEEAVPDVSKILVMTFTNAATAELVTRIRRRLNEVLGAFTGDATNDDEFVAALLARHPAEDARRILRRALRDLDLLEVCTIHGFCRRMLDQNAFETGMPFDVEYVEDDRPLLRNAAEDFWRETLGAGQELEAAVIANANIAPKTFEEDYITWRRHPGLRIEPTPLVFEEAVRRLHEGVAETRAGGWSPREARAYLEPKNFAARYRPSRTTVDTWLDAIEAFYENGRNRGIVTVIACAPMRIEKHRLKSAATAEAPFFRYWDRLAVAADDLILALRAAFVERVDRLFEREKQAASAAGYDDLLHRMRAALDDETRRPRLIEAVRRQFDAVLVDEFQDTDAIQYEIFRTLFSDSYLLFVGDPKQSIYGFRGADIFSYMRAKKVASRLYTMDKNFRSERALVTAVKHTFGAARRPFVFDEIPYIEVEAAGDADKSPIRGDDGRALVWMWLPPNTNKKLGTRDACAAVAREVVELLSAETRIGDRTVAPGDVAVLVRTNDQAQHVQQELAAAGVPAVVSKAASVLVSDEAHDMHCLLCAVLDPRNDAAVRAALATRVWGWTAREIAEANEHPQRWEPITDTFERLHMLWRDAGFAAMAYALLDAASAHERLLRQPQGQRHLTNVVHLIELLQVATITAHLTPEGLVAWFARERRRAAEAEATVASEQAELRLESDADAVQILTIHKSKGLQYPIVFAPFLWDHHERKKDKPLLVHGDTDEHTDGGAPVQAIYHCAKDPSRPIIARAQAERVSEDARLAYVAMTRAKHRCYVGWGEIGQRRASANTALAYLLYQPEPDETLAPADWVAAALEHARALDTTAWRNQLEERCAKSDDTMLVVDFEPNQDAPRWSTPAREQAELRTRTFPADALGRLVPWRMASFSSFRPDGTHAPGPSPSSERAAATTGVTVIGQTTAAAPPAEETATVRAPSATSRATSIAELPDHVDPGLPAPVEESAPAGMFAFARGVRAGVCLHEIFERIDFTRVDEPETTRLVREVLATHGLDRPEAHDGPIEPATVVETMLHDVLESEIPGVNFALRVIGRASRLSEWQFTIPTAGISAASLADLFDAHGSGLARRYAPALRSRSAQTLDGFLMGFVDLVFRYEDRWYIVDWKSNHLGNRTGDYAPAFLDDVMIEHDYVLQYHLYTLALDQYLRNRMPDYDYERHFGGVVYAFVRGVRPGSESGWFVERPSRALVDALDTWAHGKAS